MRIPRFSPTAFAAVLIASALAPLPLLAQQPRPPAPQPQQPRPPAPQPAPAPAPAQPQAAAPKPYKPVAIKLPEAVKDPTFEAFRKQLAGVVQKKDRAALGRMVAQSFFWLSGDKDAADKKKPGIENLAKAIGLDGKDAQGWDILSGYAEEATGEPDPDHPGTICAPADPSFDENAAEQLAKDTQTEASEWGYPAQDGVEVRAAAKPDAPVIGKLGLYLVRVFPDDSPAGAVAGDDFLRVVMPTGKVGFVASDAVVPLGNEQLCYSKQGNAWVIAGYIGGGTQ